MYYYNQLTGESTYERPKQLGYEARAHKEADPVSSHAG
jgi:hypothetical protein